MMTKMSTTDEQASTSAAGDAEDIQWRFSQIKGNLDVEENPTDGQSSLSSPSSPFCPFTSFEAGPRRGRCEEIRSAPLIRLREYPSN